MSDSLFIAVDLGAGSGRVFLAGLAPRELLLEETHRFQYPPKENAGHLRWDFPAIVAEIKEGLCRAGARARELERPIKSVGVDSWGVDYGLVDETGALVELPICYRDQRTRNSMAEVFSVVPRRQIFEHTGIQFLVFNTMFQLQAHCSAGISPSAKKLLLIPDLINLWLSGKAVTEYTNATTTQMVNAGTRTWDSELVERLALPGELLAEIVPAGAELGPLNDSLAKELGLAGVKVVAAATHDTGSAVAGAPLRPGWAYISSGTWSLVGVERSQPLINDDVAHQNFTNEGGAFGTIRFLKNVMGLWILESCRREWQVLGLDVSYEGLLSEAAALESAPAVIFVDDERLLNPASMLQAINQQLLESEQRVPESAAETTRVILDSLALRYASVLRSIESLTSNKIAGVHVVGGGSRNEYLNQATANASGLQVLAGPVEATVIGNVLVQAIAAQRFGSLTEARRHTGDNIGLTRFEPLASAIWNESWQRYKTLEARYSS
jgi:rhamnulokinase